MHEDRTFRGHGFNLLEILLYWKNSGIILPHPSSEKVAASAANVKKNRLFLLTPGIHFCIFTAPERKFSTLSVIPTEAGTQIFNIGKNILDSGASPGPDPGFTGVTTFYEIIRRKDEKSETMVDRVFCYS
jgi:hypothetical protein